MSIQHTMNLLSAFKDIDTDKIQLALNYLQHYGYTFNSTDDIMSSVCRFQSMAGLLVDGIVGPKTLGIMQHPRCGCKDTLEARNSPRKWADRNISYYIEKRDSDITADEWDDAITKAFTQWSDVANLKFTRTNTSRKANCIMSIGSGRSQDFDGPGGTLAWAQLPPNSRYNGQLLCRFDAGETWITNASLRGVLLLNVACHEIGHLLGLGHSQVNSALMAPFYNPSITKPQNSDDVTRISKLYGEAPEKPEKVEPTENLIIHIEGTIEGIKIPGYRVQKRG